MPFEFPLIYPILDSSTIPSSGRSNFLRSMGASLMEAGVTLLEYRNKAGNDKEILGDAETLRAAMSPKKVKLILDDRVDLVDKCGFDGAHVDSGDVSPFEARERLGPHRIVGTFGGSQSLVPGIWSAPVNYLSIGPVFGTTTKRTTNPPIGVDGVRRLREEAGPATVLVAVGGITLDSAAMILRAGASTVAASSAIFRTADPAATFHLWNEGLSRQSRNLPETASKK
jgi:thiamine-phosphate pyrophosphorylase